MSNKLEDRLSEIEKKTPIRSDRELASALMQIIEEERKEIREDNIDLISDATELLLSIRGTSECDIEDNSDRLLSEFTRNAKPRRSVDTLGKVNLWHRLSAVRRVAVFALMVISVAVIFVGFNGEARAAVRNTFVTWIRELALIDFTEEEAVETEKETVDGNVTAINSVKLNSIPDGFTLESSKKDGESIFHTYECGEDFVIVELIESDPAGIIHSTERHKYSEIMIGDTPGYLFYNEEERSGSVILGNSKVTVIVGGVAECEILLSFARGIDW